MAEIQLGVVEARFADIIWEREPVTSAGSLPAFLTAFTSEKKLTAEEITEIRELIDKAGE